MTKIPELPFTPSDFNDDDRFDMIFSNYYEKCDIDMLDEYDDLLEDDQDEIVCPHWHSQPQGCFFCPHVVWIRKTPDETS